MQTLIQIICKEKTNSLLTVFRENSKAETFPFKRIGKKIGPTGKTNWEKFKSTSVEGGLQIYWEKELYILNIRITNNGEGRPFEAVGILIEYFLGKHTDKIKSINTSIINM
ncbi:MAG: hypothetical protein ACOYMA_16685 [Bacteroidia bacterium]